MFFSSPLFIELHISKVCSAPYPLDKESLTIRLIFLTSVVGILLWLSKFNCVKAEI